MWDATGQGNYRHQELTRKRETVLNHNLKTRKSKTQAKNKQKEVNDESQIINKIENQKK